MFDALTIACSGSALERNTAMLNLLWVVAAVCVVLWALGLATSYTMGGLIYGLLILAVVAVAVRLIVGHRPVHGRI